MSRFTASWSQGLDRLYETFGHAVTVTRTGLAAPLALTLRGSQSEEDGVIGGMAPMREHQATRRARQSEIAAAATAAGAGWQGLRDGDIVTYVDAPGIGWRITGTPRVLPSDGLEVEIRLTLQRGATP